MATSGLGRRWGRTPGAARLAALVAAALALGGQAGAGDWHLGQKLVCSDCHTMHNSWKGGQPMRYDRVEAGAPKLLRGANPQAVCLACHAGGATGSTAPAVVGPLDPAWADIDPAGGHFTRSVDGTTPSGLGHTLDVTPLAIPLSTATPMPLTCLTCHEVHGNGSFRNLVPSPTKRVAAPVAIVVDQDKRANGTNPTEVYGSANMLYRSGFSQWCIDCHDDYGNGTAHPTDLRLSDYQEVFTAWTAPPVDAGGRPLRRHRVQNPDPVQPIPASPSSDDQVFCLTCHKAHGSANPRGLILPDPLNPDSTCNQCHVAVQP